MSATIKAAILALKNRIAAAYTAVSDKGGTLPATQDSDNLASAIATIPSGGITGYEFSNGATPTNVGGVFANQTYLTKITDSTYTIFPLRLFSGINDLTEISMPNIVSVEQDYVFYADYNLASVDFPKLATITGGYFLRFAKKITQLSLPELTKNSGNYAFCNLELLERLYAPKLNQINYVCFEGNPKFIDFETGGNFTANMDFRYWNPTLTDPDVLYTFLSNIRNHFAANLRSDVGNHTIRFHANVKAAIQASQETMDSFPANWTLY